MLAALNCNPAPIFRLDRGVEESVPEWKGSIFQVLEGSAPLSSPWGGEMAIAEGDLLLVAGAAAVGEMCVLVPWGHGRPMLGRVTSTGFVAEPGSVPHVAAMSAPPARAATAAGRGNRPPQR